MRKNLKDMLALLREATLIERVDLEREGIPNPVVTGLLTKTNLPRAQFQRMIGIARSTFNKKMSNKSMFDGAAGLSILGVLDLIAQAEDMRAAMDSDSDTATPFEVAGWVGR